MVLYVTSHARCRAHSDDKSLAIVSGLQEQIGAIERLTQKTMENSAIDKSGIKTFEGKLGINPAFGGSSGIMTGAK